MKRIAVYIFAALSAIAVVAQRRERNPLPLRLAAPSRTNRAPFCLVSKSPSRKLPPEPKELPLKSIAYNRYNIFTPRLGLAWDPKGDGKMSVRASAGIFTDRGALYSMS